MRGACILALLAAATVDSIGPRTTDQRLGDYLMQNYTMLECGRPVLDPRDVIGVAVSIAILNIERIDEAKGLVSANVWLRQYWTDPLLVWNSSEWGIKDITFPVTNVGTSNHIWAPDLVLYNSGEEPLKRLGWTNAVVYSDGRVAWSRPGMVKFSYTPVLDRFPFDMQNISLKFGSWAYDAGKLKLSIHDAAVDTTVMIETAEWSLIASDTQLHSRIYSCCPQPYEDIVFSLRMKRNSDWYYSQVIFPATLLAAVGWLSFWMDRTANRSARTAVCMTSLLSQITLRVVVSSRVPVTKNPTWIETFQTAMLTYNFAALVMWVFVIWLCTSKYKRAWWEPASTHSWRPDGWLSCLDRHQAVFRDLIKPALVDEKSESVDTADEVSIPFAEEVNPLEAGLGIEIGQRPEQEEPSVIPTRMELCRECRYAASAGAIQEDIKRRRQAFGLPDVGPAALLAIYVDHFMRVAFLLALGLTIVGLVIW